MGDSELRPYNAACSSKSVKLNSEIISLLRTCYKDASARFLVEFQWVRGHSLVGGNIRVDLLAKSKASACRDSSADFDIARIDSYSVAPKFWPFGFPLSVVT